MKRIVVLLLALFTTICMLVGCGTENASQGNTSSTRVITDIDGTEVTIPKDIKQVADLWHANNQVVLMLGGRRYTSIYYKKCTRIALVCKSVS